MGIGPPGESANLAVRTSTPVSVTSIVCSIIIEISIENLAPGMKALDSPNCAVRFPSAVTFVQLSGQSISLFVPRVRIGSMVKVIPGLHVPTALFFA